MWQNFFLVFPTQAAAIAAFVEAFGDDGTGNPLVDPTQVCIAYIGPLYKPTGATLTVTNQDGSTGTAPAMASDGMFNVNVASQVPLPASLAPFTITPLFPKLIFAPDSTPLPVNPPSPVYELDANGNVMLDANGNPIPITN
jgi:hypothetical protein